MTPVDDEDKTSALLQGTGSNYKKQSHNHQAKPLKRCITYIP